MGSEMCIRDRTLAAPVFDELIAAVGARAADIPGYRLAETDMH